MKRFNLITLFTILLSMVGTKVFAYHYDIAVENADGVTIFYVYDTYETQLMVTQGDYRGIVVIPEQFYYKNILRRVTAIGGEAFSNCSHLTSVMIPNSVKSIGSSAFYGCSSLTSIMIPNSVSIIGDDAFHDCNGLTTATIGNGVTSIGMWAFYGCSSLTSVTIGSSVTTIGAAAFANCSNLTSIKIPQSVTSIGMWAFDGCNSLTSVTVENPVPVSNGGDSFSNRANATLYVPYGSKAAYEATEDWKKFKEIIEVMPMKCATPTITIVDGKVSFDCETPEVTFKWNYSFDSGNAENEGNNPILSGTNTCHISVYATRDGYVDSDVATADVEVYWGKKGDVNQDGVVTITDAVSVVNIILNGGDAQAAPALEQQEEAPEAE